MTVDVVVPAHNEQATIADVLGAIRGAPATGRIIVAADACDDQTVSIASQLADVVVTLEAHDKGSAMAAGLAHVQTDLVAFCDADLRGLRPEHIEALLTVPPLEGQVVANRGDAVTGDRVPSWVAKSWGNLPSISGERRLPTALARSVRLAGSGWRAETRINVAVAEHHLPWRHILFAGVRNSTKLGRSPIQWFDEVARVIAISAAFAPELVSYVRGAGVSAPPSPEPGLGST